MRGSNGVLARCAAAVALVAAVTGSPAVGHAARSGSVGSESGRANTPRLPLYFVPNRGQTDPRVEFMVPGARATAEFTSTGVTLALGGRPTGPTSASSGGWVVRMAFADADPDVRPTGFGPTGATFSWFRGSPDRWVTGVRSYRGVVYRDLWPGVDLRFDGSGGQLEYTAVVRPGGDPRSVAMRVLGSTGLRVDGDGDLRIGAGLGRLTDRAPVAFQRVDGRSTSVDAAFRLRGADGFGFRVGAYDPRRPLVLDPEIDYLGFIGGDRGQDWGASIAVDAAGAAYVAGRTAATRTTFPVTVGPDLTYNQGYTDAFVAKVAPSGTSLEYAGYIGGSGREEALGIAVDLEGAAYVTGWTDSDRTSFPVTIGDRAYNGGFSDAFVVKVSPSGQSLEWGRYLGGARRDLGWDIAVDARGASYVAGETFSHAATFPVRRGPDVRFNGGFSDGFVAKITPAGRLFYAGYVGGAYDDEQAKAIAVDAQGAAFITGFTHSDESTFPVTVGPEIHFAGYADAYVAKVAPSGESLVYAGYIGGVAFDAGSDIAVDSSGAAYVVGDAGSREDTFPVTVGPDLTYNGSGSELDAFVAKIEPDGSGLVYAGYIGGARYDFGQGVALDPDGAAYVVGDTHSGRDTFPVTGGALDRTFNGIGDVFVARVRVDGTGLDWAGYIGGSQEDFPYGIARDPAGDLFITGVTATADGTFPVTKGPDLIPDGGDAFVGKITGASSATSVRSTGTAPSR